MFYSMNNPPECPYKSTCLLSGADDDDDAHRIACRKYQRSCYAPLWSDKNHMVDIKLYVTDTSVLVDGRVSKPRPQLVWNITNHKTTERLACNITYNLLSRASMTGESISGTFYFISKNTAIADVGDIASPVPVVRLKVTLAERRKLSGSGYDRKRVMRLVDSQNHTSTAETGGLAKVAERSAYYGYMNSGDGNNRSESAIFWKFLHQPITIRFAEVYKHVSRHTLTSLLAHDIIVHDTRPVTNVDMDMQHPSVIMPRYKYEPLLWLDDLSITQRQYAVINMPSSSATTAHNTSSTIDETTPQAAVSIKFQFDYVPTSPMYFGIKKVAEIQLNTITDLLSMGNKGSGSSNEIVDELRYYLSERHLYQLMVTQVIAIVHIIFEYLAFRDDLSFFSRQKSFVGLSSSGLYFAFIRNLIVFLYLLDNDTSWMVLFSVAKDTIYSLWKVLQVLRPNIIAAYNAWNQSKSLQAAPLTDDVGGGAGGGGGGEDKGKTTALRAEEERRIMDYDSTAVRYCSYLLCPMLAILSAYNLKTTVYASWWSWCISSLVDFVYLFGFISMVPQLYINYKLKSVAHLPIRAFMFKLFNTFIDDVFVLLMKMPLKHRLMALRDDVIFLGFLYQWWIYPSDKSRVNEFGYQYSEHE